MTQRDDPLNRALSRSIRRIVPFLVLMFLVSFLDRVNVGFAKTALQADTGIGDRAFAMGLGLFFIGYALFETPSNLVMHRVGARRWMSRIMITWGLASAAMLFVRGTYSFYVLRCVLGIAEAGFFPGVALYLTYWFPSQTRGRAMGHFYVGLCLSFIVGGPVSGALLDLDGFGGLHGWQWMFLVEGLAACLVGAVAFWYLDDRPSMADWLEPDERQALEQVIADESALIQSVGHGALQLLFDIKVLYCALIFCISQIALYGVTFYLPTQVAGMLGRKVGLEVGTISAIPWLCALLACLTIPAWSDRAGERRWTATSLAALCSVGLVLGSGAWGPLLGFGGLCVATAAIVSLQPIYFIFPTAYLKGRRAAAGLGVITSIGAMGGFLAPNVRVLGDLQAGPPAGAYFLSAIAVLNVVLIGCLPLLELAVEERTSSSSTIPICR
ncbi:MFS transporter [Paraburkholderia flava]|uniref:MFS transporter n=1 Tax=Paraburkholderia flava TaxID=2547393 RepID=UPI00105D6105|nr:MFS transporter [Paraburkholderia flava]